MADSSSATTPRGHAMELPKLKLDLLPGTVLKEEGTPRAGLDNSRKGGGHDSDRSRQADSTPRSKPAAPLYNKGLLISFLKISSVTFNSSLKEGSDLEKAKQERARYWSTPTDADFPQDELLKLETFLFDFAAALLQSGAPVHKTEKIIDDTSVCFSIQTTFIVFPGVVLATFGKLPNAQSAARRVSVGLNCARLALLDDLAASIKAKETGLEDAIERLSDIMKKPPTFSKWVKLLCLTISSGFISPMFFGGGWRDMLISAVFGTIVGLIGIASGKWNTLDRLNEIISALLVSFCARIASAYIPGLCLSAINFSAICWLLPGLSVTTAMIEMATRHIISGTTRMFYAFLIAIELGFGIAVGQRIPWFTPQKDALCTTTLDIRYNALFFPVTVLCWNLLMDANPWQWISMSICAGVGYVVSWAMTTKGHVSPDVTAATAAFAVAVVGNLWGRLTGHAPIVPILGGILILVPGSLGVRGVLGFLTGNSDNGLNFALQMIIVALSIAIGVFVGQLVEIPKFLCHKKLNKINIAL